MNIVKHSTGPFLSLYLSIVVVIYGCFIQTTRLYASQNEYKLVAENFLKFLNSNKVIQSGEWIESNELNPSLAKERVAYLVNLGGGGYILISASKSLSPVKAYSLKNSFSALPPGYKGYLLSELEYPIRVAIDSERSRRKSSLETDPENQQRWEFLLKFDDTKRLYKYVPNTFLLKTHWRQDYPYNKFLPEVEGKAVKTGCLNTAMAQLMKYYNYPLSGKKIAVAHTWNGQTLRAYFSKNYHWQNMPDSIDGFTPVYQQDEVARLLRDLAIANHTEFGVNGSSAVINTDILVRIFGYAKDIKTLTNAQDSLFFSTLRNEIDNYRPVLLNFPNHITVADGYSSNSTGKEIHVNFGWGEESDDYYFLDKSVTTNSYPTTFTTKPGDLSIYYNIKPCSGSDCDTNLESEDQIQAGTIYGVPITGKFNTDRDCDEYKVYLKGQTTITGYRNSPLPIGNRSFIVSIFDMERNLIISNDGKESISTPAISTTLPAAKYFLKISICDETGACYGYGTLIYYTVYVNTRELTIAEKTLIDSYDTPPLLNNNFNDMIINSLVEPTKILLDAVDPDGDPVSLSAASTNTKINVSIDSQDVLCLSPTDGLSRAAAKISVSAKALDKTTTKSFIVMVLQESISFGQEFEIIGRFENQNTFNRHQVILDGPCLISGSNGYANQGFYTSILNTADEFLVDPIDTSIQQSMAANQYQIGASLRQNPLSSGGLQYTYHSGLGDVYSIKVKCPEAEVDTVALASMLDIPLTGTGLKTSPVLAVYADESCGLAPLTVQFTSMAEDNDGYIVSYQWEFGDGKKSVYLNPTYTFTSAGNYLVSCKVTDNDGLSDSCNLSIIVNQDKLRMGTIKGSPLEGGLTDCLAYGRNALLLYNTSCYPYTSFDLLRECSELGTIITLHHLMPKSGSLYSTYHFFGQIIGKKIELPEQTESSENIPFSDGAYQIIDLDQKNPE